MRAPLASIVAGVLLIAACSTGSEPIAGDRNTGRHGRSSVSSSAARTTTPTTLPPVVPYDPLPNEPLPVAKIAAAEVVQALGTYETGGGILEAARERLRAIGVAPEIADQAGVLFGSDAPASIQVVYPQLGGFSGEEASVMVVARQTVAKSGGQSATTRTVDVRVRRQGDEWLPIAIASVGGLPPGRTSPLSGTADLVLTHERIDLPDSARWDIQSGLVDERILSLVLQVAADHWVSVSVFASGHPHNVFGAGVVSNHTEGRAVDIWAIDDVPVSQAGQGDGTVLSLVEELAGAGVTELGSPWDLGDPGGVTFTNTVHEDHLHLGYDQ